MLSHLLDGAVGGGELVLVGHVDPVEAGETTGGDDTRTCTSAAPASKSICDELARGVPPDDRVVDDDDPLALDLAERVELHPDPLFAHPLFGLDERARDVAVLDERLVVRDAGPLREADRGRRPAVGDADDEVRVGGRLAREPLAHTHACAVHLDSADPRVRAGEVHVLEDAQRIPPGGNGLRGVEPFVVDPDDLARLHVADRVGTDEVERTRL